MTAKANGEISKNKKQSRYTHKTKAVATTGPISNQTISNAISEIFRKITEDIKKLQNSK